MLFNSFWIKGVLAILPAAVLAVSLARAEEALAYTPIPLVHANPGGLDLVQVKVDGMDHLFLVDTGCARSVLYSTELAKSLGKTLKPTGNLTGVGGDMKSYVSDFGEVTIGGRVSVSGKESLVSAVDHLESLKVDGKAANPQGLVGSKLFAVVRGVLDLPAGKILVPGEGVPADGYKRAMGSQGARVIPMAKGKFEFPYVAVELNGKSYAFLLDTGANADVLDPVVVKELGLREESGDTEVKGAGKVSGVKSVKVEKVRIPGGVNLAGMQFHVIDTHGKVLAPEGMKAGGILGCRTLHAIKARLDFGSYSLILPKN